MMQQKKWILKQTETNKVNTLTNALKIHPILCQLLAQRGISNFDQAKQFFRPQLADLHNPFLMKGMDIAVDKIINTIERREAIMIYGDYDVDGTTAVAVVYSFLKRLPQINAEKLHYYIPNRYTEGYGISQQGIDKAEKLNCRLIITLDCGIKAFEKITYAKSKNIDIIVCDHHLPGELIPPAYAILNPKQRDCTYPYKELSGCGIGFKLISALAQKFKLPDEQVHIYLDLVATSIAADIVPMDGENRVLAFYGVKRANESPCLALTAIKEVAGLTKPFSINDLVFVIAPRINAAGRMNDAGKAVELFIEKNVEKAKLLADALQADNVDRKEIDKSITEEALEAIREEEDKNGSRQTTVLFRSHWHKGVVGIVASRLIEHYYRPTIILTSSNGMLTGSARSVNGVNIYDAIHSCSDLLEAYGGHYFAAGMTLKESQLDRFKQRFEQAVVDMIGQEPLIPQIDIDALINFSDINSSFYNIIKQFEPFGPNNLRPVFLTRKLSNVASKIVKKSHIRFVVKQGKGLAMTGIGFGLAEKFSIIESGEPFDLVYTIDENEWNGMTNLQIKVLDINYSLF